MARAPWKNAAHVDCHRSFPVVEGSLGDFAIRRDARIVYKHIEAPETFDCRIDQGFDWVVFRDVDDVHQRSVCG